MAPNKKHLTMKLLINGPSKKVLFAEAGKEVVDFLFSLLGMPLGTAIKLLSNDRMVGCIGSLYRSLQGLGEDYIESQKNKDALLNPKVPCSTSLLLTDPTIVSKYYMCDSLNYCDDTIVNNYCNNITNVDGAVCPDCGVLMIREVVYIAPVSTLKVDAVSRYYKCSCNNNYATSGSRTKCPNCKRNMKKALTFVNSKEERVDQKNGDTVGCVKGLVTYTIMDDLTIALMSTIAGITLLNKFKVKDLSSLQEKTVAVGINEVLELLKASLESKTVLTDTFLRKEWRA